MYSLSSNDVDLIYECCDQQAIRTHLISHEKARLYSNALRQLERSLGDDAQEQFWENLLRPFKRFRFRLAALPLAFNSQEMIPERLVGAIETQVPICRRIYPSHFPQLLSVAELAKSLSESSDAPLFDCISEVIEQLNASSINEITLLIRGHTSPEAQQFLRDKLDCAELRIIDTSSLTQIGPTNHLLAVGPLSWYPEHLQTAPRSKHLSVFRFRWFLDGLHLKPSLITSDPNKTFFRPGLPPTNIVPNDTDFEPLEILPSLHWADIDKTLAQQWQNEVEDERIPARLIILSQSRAVYADARNAVRFMVISINESSRLTRLLIDELEPGFFLLLRTEGGGDLIEPIANQLLGDRANDIHQSQAKWKNALSELTTQSGDQLVISELLALGCKRASLLNLRNWKNKNNIRPEYDDDFLSILLLCGLDADEKRYVANARMLDTAHRAAGFKIRKRLLKRVEQINIAEMVAAGSVEIQLPGSTGIGFTAFRIRDISPEYCMVPFSRINQPFVMDTHHG